MRIYLLISLFLFSYVISSAQDITGLWTGYLSTTEKTLPYELVISKKNGALTAYSHITFTVNGKEIISVKKLKAGYEMRHLVLEDEDLLKDNFEKNAPKKISQTAELDFRMNGKQMIFEGSFKTKATRSLRSAQGVIILYKSPDPLNAQSKIQTDLQELKLDDALVVFKPLPVEDIAVATPVKQPETNPAPVAVSAATTPPKNPVVAATKPVVITKPSTTTPVVKQPATAATKPVEAKPTTVSTPPRPLPVLAAIDLSKRKIEVIDDITVFSDSLVFSLYDNGEVDGDSVSVVLNGRTIMAKQRLSTKASTQTIYLTPELGDSLQIVMFAENMGLYPPNTGLLIIQDGNRRREVRFSGDLNKNAAILLRRNK